MSATNPESDKYAAASQKFNDAYNKYSGENGLNSATSYAKTQAEEQAQRQSSLAANNAASSAVGAARSAGVNKAKAALMGEKAAADTTGNTYGSTYQNTYNTGMSNALANNQATVNATQSNLTTAQQEGQNEYNRTWGNVTGAGNIISGVGSAAKALITSDERVKHFQDVSSRVGIKAEPKDDYALLKVDYKKIKKENQ